MKYFFFLLFLCSTVYGSNERIISLAPNVTEILYFIGKGDALIADTTACNYPEKAGLLPKIGDMWNINIEKIASLKPDLVIASYSGNSKDQIERLESIGLKVITLKEQTEQDILSNIVFLGKLLNADVTGKIQDIGGKLKNIKKTSHKKKALIFISLFPFYSASKYSFLGSVLENAGFENAAVSAVRYPVISEETLARLNPEILFIPDRFKKEIPSLRDIFKRLRINPEIVFVNEDIMSRPGPRIFDFMLQINQYSK